MLTEISLHTGARAIAFALAIVTATLAAPSHAASPSSHDPHLAPLAYLAGHCWKGTIPGTSAVDEHCFTWMYAGKYLRDRHEVSTNGKAVYEGESIYYWNAGAKRIEYFYVTAAGGHAHGTVIPEDDTLSLPATNLVMPTQVTAFRGRWTRLGNDAYEVLREYQKDRGWTPVTMRMERVIANWGRGPEGQRKADLGNGTFRNPILGGDYPDPTIVRDGDDYYMTFSSFDAVPGLVVWHSRDLVNWQPLGPALTTPVESVWAPDLVKHDGRFWIYFIAVKTDPATGARERKLWVVSATNIRGPWSAPHEIVVKDARGRNGATIDPGHAVGEDGKRYLFMAGGVRVQLRDDGLAVAEGEAGIPKTVYEGWKYPEEWDVESFSMEGPKIVRRGDYFYMVLAEGGTAGPPTGHMVIVARSKSIHGPWENDPGNPIARTKSAAEPWWSRGHATILEGPGGKWYMVHHGYERGFWTLGRQALLEPITWTPEGWPRAAGGDLGQPLAMPVTGRAVPHGLALSDSFTPERFPLVWRFFKPSAGERSRATLKDGTLTLVAEGSSPKDSTPLFLTAADRSYELEVTMEWDEGAQPGVLLFYHHALYVGLAFNAKGTVMHRFGQERNLGKLPGLEGRKVHVRLRNREQIVSVYTSPDGKAWTKYGTQWEVSGYHHNVGGDFLALQPALYAAGRGTVRFSDVKYRALPPI